MGNRVFASWIIFSLVGTLIVCCELFASPSGNSQYQIIDKADKSILPYDSTDHYHSALNIQSAKVPPADSNHCIDRTLLDSAVSKYLVINTPDPGKNISLASYDSIPVPSVQFADIVSPHNDLPPVSPPLYLLFHRLLIAHPLA